MKQKGSNVVCNAIWAPLSKKASDRYFSMQDVTNQDGRIFKKETKSIITYSNPVSSFVAL
jgi:hypothetical protein